MNIRDFYARGTHEENTEHLARVMREGSDRFETQYQRKDGQVLDVEVGMNCVEIAGNKLLFSFFHDITKRKRADRALRERENELEIKASSLEEVNTALKVLLKRREEDRKELEEKVVLNVREFVVPYVERLKKSRLDERQEAYVEILESNLNNIISPFLHRMSVMHLHLTPTEIQVANLIRHGKRTKEIAEVLNLSIETINSHRKNIRKKIGIKKKKANLRSRLLSMKE